MLNFFLIKKTQVIAQNCGAWKLVAMALNKAQGFGYPFLKRWKTHSNHPKTRHQQNQQDPFFPSQIFLFKSVNYLNILLVSSMRNF
jgi:hypothetical protein